MHKRDITISLVYSPLYQDRGYRAATSPQALRGQPLTPPGKARCLTASAARA